MIKIASLFWFLFFLFFRNILFGQMDIQRRTDTLYGDSNYFVTKEIVIHDLNLDHYTILKETYQYSTIGYLMNKFHSVDGFTQGEFRSYHPNGNIKEIYWCRDDIKVGKYLAFYANGNLKVIGQYRDYENKSNIQFEVDSIIEIDPFGGESVIVVKTPASLKTGIWQTFSIDGKLESTEEW